jgi:putative hydrolase of the HAD superfamily
MSRLRVIFDLDDTLYPERTFALSAFAEADAWAQQALGVEGLSADMTRLLDAGHLGQLFTLVLEQRGIDTRHGPQLIALYRGHQPADLQLYADAGPVLAHFAAVGPIGLITDGTVEVQQAKVRALKIEQSFAQVIYTHAAGGSAFAKPHPHAFETMQAALGGADDRFVYVGDNPAKDFVAPNRMGWTTVQVVRPQRIHDSAKVAAGGAPHHVIRTLSALPALLA